MAGAGNSETRGEVLNDSNCLTVAGLHTGWHRTPGSCHVLVAQDSNDSEYGQGNSGLRHGVPGVPWPRRTPPRQLRSLCLFRCNLTQRLLSTPAEYRSCDSDSALYQYPTSSPPSP
eukprot:756382-Hanusia_phi.AAC.1